VSQRYTVELEALLALVDRLGEFNVRAEQIATAVDRYIAELHTTWRGDGANAHENYHTMWMSAMDRMREGLDDLRNAARAAHRNYTEVARLNTAMWP
jgi:WXG100 family type VII secretion target